MLWIFQSSVEMFSNAKFILLLKFKVNVFVVIERSTRRGVQSSEEEIYHNGTVLRGNSDVLGGF